MIGRPQFLGEHFKIVLTIFLISDVDHLNWFQYCAKTLFLGEFGIFIETHCAESCMKGRVIAAIMVR